MEKKRVYELARDLNLSTKDLLTIIKDMGISVNSHMSAIDPDAVQSIIEKIRKPKEKPPTVPKKVIIAEKVITEPKKFPKKEKPPVIEEKIITEPKKFPPKGKPFVEGKKPPVDIKKFPPKGKPFVEGKKPPVDIKKFPQKEKPLTEEEKAKLLKEKAKPVTKAQEPETVVKAEVVKKKKKELELKKELKREDVVFTWGRHPRKDRKKYKKEKKLKKEQLQQTETEQSAETKNIIKIREQISVKDLAELLKVSVANIIKDLMKAGQMLSASQRIDSKLAAEVAGNYGYSVEVISAKEMLSFESADSRLLTSRPPVVTIMGHVDHGKTSLLDAIRETKVTETEKGGITQRIGAYQVVYKDRKITFVDTPGHEAFVAMRARGAQVTDIVILVVAADDGVKPQTIEAINHVKSANVPIIVAINKIDKPSVNIDLVKQQLSELSLIPEEWGGSTVFVNVSAKKKIGIDDLLEMILLVADMSELKANSHRPAIAIVMEAQLDKGQGPTADILIKDGTLKIGDSVVVGSAYGKLRAMVNDRGERVKKAVPSTPVKIVGLSDVPQAGDFLQTVKSEKEAKQIATQRSMRAKEEKLQPTIKKRFTLEELYLRMQEEEIIDLNLVIKADVQGSVEALKEALIKLSNDQVKLNIILEGTGNITENDVTLASASNAIIIGFNVKVDVNAKKISQGEKVDIRLYGIIYNVIEDIKNAMTGLLKPVYAPVLVGRAQVKAIFSIPKTGKIAGSYVYEGKILREADAKVWRGTNVVFEGKINSLKRFKEDVKEVAFGHDCGIGVANFSEFESGDLIEAFVMEVVPAK